MTDLKTAAEVFEAAMAMEQVGKDFYTALAQGCDNAQVREFCRLTAAAEAEHYAVFRQMRDDWAGPRNGNRLAPETAERLRAMVKARVQPAPETVRKVGLHGSLKEALAMAIGMERASVDFYQGLLGLLPSLGDQIRPIIKEENAHLLSLKSFGSMHRP